MTYGSGRIASAFKKVLASFGWGGDLVPDADGTQSIGSAAIGLEELHIALNLLLVTDPTLPNTLAIRNSADTGYNGLSPEILYLRANQALSRIAADNFLLGSNIHVPSLPTLTTAQQNALTENASMMIFNSDLVRFQHVLDGTNWETLTPTKEKFWGVHSEDTEQRYAVHSLVGALSDNFTGQFPRDMSAIKEMYIAVIPKQDDIVMSWLTANAAPNEAANTHNDNGNVNVTIGGITDKIFEIDITPEFATALANDYFGIEVTGNAGDTLKILGIHLIYR